MRKSFAILTRIFVCALSALSVVSQPNVSASVDQPSSLSARLSQDEATRRINEARQLLQAAPDLSRDAVRLALFDPEAGAIRTVSLAKDEFLTKNAELTLASQDGRQIALEIVRANGVNTAVVANDSSSGQALVPLMVQYPIERNGAIAEIAYYTSAHPALLSTEVSSAGQLYVRDQLNQAVTDLAAAGVSIPSDIVDIAEHLCVVEHTDHKRFMHEDQSELFPEILSLYALNQGSTFRYSVSTAGAGGMIQMIPQTYAAIRQQHPNVPLRTDFVDGMRDHANASRAMLLYMNDTWTGLATKPEVQEALTSGLASKPELLAAGYNSNPMRLPQYLKNGGSQWRTLIPAETQMYLAIYSAVDRNLQSDEVTARETSKALPLSLETKPLTSLSWLAQSLFRASLLGLFR